MRRSVVVPVAVVAGAIAIGAVIWYEWGAVRMGMPTEAPKLALALGDRHAIWLKAALNDRPQTPPTILLCSPVPQPMDGELADLSVGIRWLANRKLLSLPTLRGQPEHADECRVTGNLKLSPGLLLNGKQARDVASRIATDLVFWGTVRREGDQLRFAGKLGDAHLEGNEKAVSFSGPSDDPTRCASLLAERVVQAAGIRVPEDEWATADALTLKPSTVALAGRCRREDRGDQAAAWPKVSGVEGNDSASGKLVSLLFACPPLESPERLKLARELTTAASDNPLLQRNRLAELIGAKDWDAYEREAGPVLERWPDNYWLMMQLRHYYDRRGNEKEAVQAAERVCEAVPASVKAKIELLCALSRWGHETRQWRTWGDIPEHLRDPLADSYEQRVSVFESVVAQDPSDPMVWAHGIKCYGNAGDFERADECFRKAVALDPCYVGSYSALICFCLPQWYDRPQRLRELVALARRQKGLRGASSLDYMASVLASPYPKGNFKDDAVHFRKLAIKERGIFATARAGLAETYRAMGRTKDALEQARLAIQDREKEGDKYAGSDFGCLWGTEAFNRNYYDLGLLYWQWRLKQMPNDQPSMVNIGHALWETGHHPEAVAQFEKVREAHPSSGEASLALAAHWDGKGDRTKALEYLREAVSRTPGCTTDEWVKKNLWGPDLRKRLKSLRAWAEPKLGTEHQQHPAEAPDSNAKGV